MFEWLWLEDEGETVADFKAAAKEVAVVRNFNRIPDLTRYLLEVRPQIEAGSLSIGFILDVMIQGSHAVTRPQGWYGGGRELAFYANHGLEAGLVFYEQLILGKGEGAKALMKPLPPVVFLTVMHSDSASIQERLDEIRQRWANVRGVELEDARVRFMRKWDSDASGLAVTLQAWEED